MTSWWHSNTLVFQQGEAALFKHFRVNQICAAAHVVVAPHSQLDRRVDGRQSGCVGLRISFVLFVIVIQVAEEQNSVSAQRIDFVRQLPQVPGIDPVSQVHVAEYGQPHRSVQPGASDI